MTEEWRSELLASRAYLRNSLHSFEQQKDYKLRMRICVPYIQHAQSDGLSAVNVGLNNPLIAHIPCAKVGRFDLMRSTIDPLAIRYSLALRCLNLSPGTLLAFHTRCLSPFMLDTGRSKK